MRVLSGLFLFFVIGLISVPAFSLPLSSYVGWGYWISNTETRVGTQNLLMQGFELVGPIPGNLQTDFRVFSGNSRVVQIDFISAEFSRPVFDTGHVGAGMTFQGLATFHKDKATNASYTFQSYSPGLFVNYQLLEAIRWGGKVRVAVLHGTDGSATYGTGVDWDTQLGFLFRDFGRLTLVFGYRKVGVDSTLASGATVRERIEGFYVETHMAF